MDKEAMGDVLKIIEYLMYNLVDNKRFVYYFAAHAAVSAAWMAAKRFANAG